MGFFDKILQGLGFEGDDNDIKKVKPVPKQVEAKKLKNEYVLNTPKPKNSLDFCDFTPKNQNDILEIIKYLKKGYSVKVDFSNFSEEDLYRAIDFFQGACYALGLEPNHIESKIFQIIGFNNEV